MTKAFRLVLVERRCGLLRLHRPLTGGRDFRLLWKSSASSVWER